MYIGTSEWCFVDSLLWFYIFPYAWEYLRTYVLSYGLRGRLLFDYFRDFIPILLCRRGSRRKISWSRFHNMAVRNHCVTVRFFFRHRYIRTANDFLCVVYNEYNIYSPGPIIYYTQFWTALIIMLQWIPKNRFKRYFQIGMPEKLE